MMPKGLPKRGDDQLLEGGGAGSGRMTVAERWATRSSPDSNWASLKGPKTPKEIKEEHAARIKADNDFLTEFAKNTPKTLTAEQKAGMSPAQLRRAERAEKNFADKTNTYPVETPEGMKKGGMTASRRADGIAQRGKTKGRLV